MKDTQLFQRATKMAKHLATFEPQASKMIRSLVSQINERDRELREWREGRAHKALQRENESLTAANAHLLVMLKQLREGATND